MQKSCERIENLQMEMRRRWQGKERVSGGGVGCLGWRRLITISNEPQLQKCCQRLLNFATFELEVVKAHTHPSVNMWVSVCVGFIMVLIMSYICKSGKQGASLGSPPLRSVCTWHARVSHLNSKANLMSIHECVRPFAMRLRVCVCI